jgi:hypothetical protein
MPYRVNASNEVLKRTAMVLSTSQSDGMPTTSTGAGTSPPLVPSLTPNLVSFHHEDALAANVSAAAVVYVTSLGWDDKLSLRLQKKLAAEMAADGLWISNHYSDPLVPAFDLVATVKGLPVTWADRQDYYIYRKKAGWKAGKKESKGAKEAAKAAGAEKVVDAAGRRGAASRPTNDECTVADLAGLNGHLSEAQMIDCLGKKKDDLQRKTFLRKQVEALASAPAGIVDILATLTAAVGEGNLLDVALWHLLDSGDRATGVMEGDDGLPWSTVESSGHSSGSSSTAPSATSGGGGVNTAKRLSTMLWEPLGSAHGDAATPVVSSASSSSSSTSPSSSAIASTTTGALDRDAIAVASHRLADRLRSITVDHLQSCLPVKEPGLRIGAATTSNSAVTTTHVPWSTAVDSVVNSNGAGSSPSLTLLQLLREMPHGGGGSASSTSSRAMGRNLEETGSGATSNANANTNVVSVKCPLGYVGVELELYSARDPTPVAAKIGWKVDRWEDTLQNGYYIANGEGSGEEKGVMDLPNVELTDTVGQQAGRGGAGTTRAGRRRRVQSSPCCACILQKTQMGAASAALADLKEECAASCPTTGDGGDDATNGTAPFAPFDAAECLRAVELMSPCVDPLASVPNSSSVLTSTSIAGGSTAAASSETSTSRRPASVALAVAIDAARDGLRPFVVDTSCGVHVHVSTGVPPRVSVDALPAHVNPVSLLKLLQVVTETRSPVLHFDRGIQTLVSLGSMCALGKRGTKRSALLAADRGNSISTRRSAASPAENAAPSVGDVAPWISLPVWVQRGGAAVTTTRNASVQVGESAVHRVRRVGLCRGLWAALDRVAVLSSGALPAGNATSAANAVVSGDNSDAISAIVGESIDTIVDRLEATADTAEAELGEGFLRIHRLASNEATKGGKWRKRGVLAEFIRRAPRQGVGSGASVRTDEEATPASSIDWARHPSFDWALVAHNAGSLHRVARNHGGAGGDDGGGGGDGTGQGGCTHCRRLHRQSRAMAEVTERMLRDVQAYVGAKKKGGAKKSGGSGESGGSTVALLGGGNVTFLTSVGAFFERLGREVDDEAAPDYFKWQVRWNGGWLVHVYCMCGSAWSCVGRCRS